MAPVENQKKRKATEDAVSSMNPKERRDVPSEISVLDPVHWCVLDTTIKSASESRRNFFRSTDDCKSELALDFFKTYCVGKFEQLDFAKCADEKAVLRCTSRYLGQIKASSQDPAVVFFLASENTGCEDDWSETIYKDGKPLIERRPYKLVFKTFQQKMVDGYKFIQVLVDSGVPCLLLLDAYLPKRFLDVVKRPKDHFFHLEIITHGMPTSDLELFITRCKVPTEPKATKYEQRGFLGWEKPFTIPELMRLNPYMSDSPRRIWMKSRGKGLSTERFLFHPILARKDENLQLCRSRIKGPSKNSSFELPDDIDSSEIGVIRKEASADEVELNKPTVQERTWDEPRGQTTPLFLYSNEDDDEGCVADIGDESIGRAS